MLSKITNHKSNRNAILISDGFIKSINFKNVLKKITAGCKIQLEWKDGSTS